MNHQKISQINPREPVTIKAICQPKAAQDQWHHDRRDNRPDIGPELKIPVASALSFLGNHSATRS